jgi:serine/threonine-protein kinase
MTVVGRYELGEEIGRGGMARVHVARLVGAVGFSRAVAIKSMHPGLANDASFVRMFIDEARIASRVRHANVVSVLDVVAADGALHLVMEYVPGVPLHRLMAAGPAPFDIARGLMFGVLSGLHAAHEARDERGKPLGIVHRDVSPQNVLVGEDGVPRLLDFGVAKAADRLQSTGDGHIKGKLPYMSPEQLSGFQLDRRSDLFGAMVMAWELVVGDPLFARDSEAATVTAVLRDPIARVATRRGDVPTALDELIARALERDREARPATALELACALEASGRIAPAHEIAEWMARVRPRDGGRTAAAEPVLGDAPIATHTIDAPLGVPRGRASFAGGAETSASRPERSVQPRITTDVPTGGDAPRGKLAPRSRPRMWISVGAATVIAAGVAARTWWSAAHASAPAQASVESSGAPPVTHSAPPRVANTAPAPIAETAPPGPAEGSGSPARDTRTSHRPTTPPPPRVRKPPRHTDATADCRIVNPDGTIGYKAECLK